MNILVSIGSPDFTGGPRMALVMIRALVAAGHHVLVVSGQRPPSEQGSVLDILRQDGIRLIEETGFERKMPDRSLVRRISQLVRRERIQCLISEQQLDFKIMPLVARQTSVKLIYHVQNPARFSGNSIVQAVKRYSYRRLLLPNVSQLICVSEAVRRQHIREFGVAPGKTAVVENGVDLSQFSRISANVRAAKRAELGVTDNELMLMNVGRLTIQKGQDLLLRALARANLNGRPFKLVVVGSPTYGIPEDEEFAANLRELATRETLAGRVVFAGWRDDIPSLLSSADMYLHSANWEGFPGGLATLEAMAASLPCVSTDCAGTLADFVPGQHGDVVPTGDEDAFKRAIERLFLLDDASRWAIGDAGRELVEKQYSIERSASHFVRLVEQDFDQQDQISGDAYRSAIREHNQLSASSCN